MRELLRVWEALGGRPASEMCLLAGASLISGAVAITALAWLFALAVALEPVR